MIYTPTQQIVRKIARLKKKGLEETSVTILELNKQLEELRNNYLETPRSIIEYPVRYNSFYNNDSKTIDIVTIFQLIKSNKTNYVYNSRNRYNSKYKRNTYSPCGLFYGTNSIRKLNNLLLFQIQGKALTKSEWEKLTMDEFTFASYYAMEDKVTNIFVQAENCTLKNIPVYQQEIQKYYERLLKNSKIICQTIYSVLPLTHDYNLYYNTNSSFFKINQ